MNLTELQAEYTAARDLATAERAKLEQMREAFVIQCATTDHVEIKASQLKKRLTDALLRGAGIEPGGDGS